MTSHFRLDFHGVEDLNSLNTEHAITISKCKRIPHLAVVDTDNTTDHLGNDNHVTKMSFDYGGFLIWGCLFLSFAQFLDETHWASLETASEPATCASVHELC